jgi:hypothetical protein
VSPSVSVAVRDAAAALARASRAVPVVDGSIPTESVEESNVTVLVPADADTSACRPAPASSSEGAPPLIVSRYRRPGPSNESVGGAPASSVGSNEIPLAGDGSAMSTDWPAGSMSDCRVVEGSSCAVTIYAVWSVIVSPPAIAALMLWNGITLTSWTNPDHPCGV